MAGWLLVGQANNRTGISFIRGAFRQLIKFPWRCDGRAVARYPRAQIPPEYL